MESFANVVVNDNTSIASTVTVPSTTDEIQKDQPVDLEADSLTHDEDNQIITASGHVELVQSGRILKADTVSYNLQTDKVRATGNVVLSENDGTTYFADDVELSDNMKDGFVQGLNVLLADGSRFSAASGIRTSGTVIELQQATYTPCDPCKEDPTRPPLWQIRAKEVKHDAQAKQISYKDAWFELAGVPLVYTPYFSHPDGSEKQKSGFLTPYVRFDSKLGVSYQQQYYWAIAPDRDFTFGAAAYTSTNPLALAEFRQRFEDASLNLSASTTYSKRTDNINGNDVLVKNELRGHIFGDVLWDMNDKWRSGAKLEIASDDQYLRQYKIHSQDVLENELYLERFDDRDYTVARAIGFQDLRTGTKKVDQPAVLPEIQSSFYGTPNDVLGGRWNAKFSTLGIYRTGSGQDVGRASSELGWQKRYITGFGLVNKIDGLLRGDAYNIYDRVNATLNPSDDSKQFRAFVQANWEVSYPVAKRLEKSQIVLTPIFSLTAGTDANQGQKIPNEDSQDFSLDTTNLFEPNRSPGYDLIEDKSHMTYGLRSGWYGDSGYEGELFFGQSRRFNKDDGAFNLGSGLTDQTSDYVGEVSAKLSPLFDFDYKIQLDNESLASERHQINSSFNWDRYQLGAQYFYANAIQGSGLDESRQQIRPFARVRVYDDWYMSSGAWYDLGRDPGLRQATYGLDYEGQCLTFSLSAQRNLTRDSSGDNGTEIMARLGLKNLGSVQTSGIQVKSGESKTDATSTNQ